MQPTDEMIEAGRMALVDATGHGYGPELVRAVYDAMQAVAPDPWQPIETAPEDGRFLVNGGGWRGEWSPRQTIAGAVMVDRISGGDFYVADTEGYLPIIDGPTHWQPSPPINMPLADWLRSQGGE